MDTLSALLSSADRIDFAPEPAADSVSEQYDVDLLPPGVVLTTDITVEGMHVVLVIDPPNAIAAQLALQSFARGKIGAAVLRGETDSLTTVMGAVADGVGAVSQGVRSLAGEIPPLTLRQLDIARGLVDGASNERIAEVEAISMSTLKREIRRIRTFMRCRNRGELAVRLGASPSTPANHLTSGEPS